MIESLQKQIEDAKKIIEVLPVNNKENREKKSAYLMEEEIKSLNADIAVVCSYVKLFPKEFFILFLKILLFLVQ